MADLDAGAGDRGIAVVLALLSFAVWAALSATTTSKEGDFFESPAYWATWLLFPVVALTVTVFRPTGRTALIAASALVVPLMVILGILGTIGHDPDDGASLWLVGETLLLIQAVFVWIGSLIGIVTGNVRNNARRHG